MAENANDPVTAPRKVTIESVEEEIARTRQRLTVTLAQLNGDARALINPNTPVVVAPAGRRDAVDTVAAGLRTAGRIGALARPGTSGPFGMLRAATGLTMFLFRSGMAWRAGSRKRR
jgi:hypothetical protein